MKDPYKVLGVEPDTSPEDIKKAYRKLAFEYHPDRNPDDKAAEEKLKEINEAYDLVKDGKWSPGSQPNFRSDFNPFDINSVFRNFGVGFDSVFGNRQTKVKRTGRIQITLEEAYAGCKKNITVSDRTTCPKCKGFGFELGEKPCGPCKGTGEAIMMHGVVTLRQQCPYCRGLGREIKAMCMECQGSGKKENSQNFEIVIPAGIRHGQKVHPANDLEITVLFAPHREFMLMENMSDIMSKIRISMFDAILGTSVKVNTLQGQKSLKIIPGMQPGDVMRIRGGGMKGGYLHPDGDHLVEVIVELPKTLSAEQKELLNRLKETMESKGEDNG